MKTTRLVAMSVAAVMAVSGTAMAQNMNPAPNPGVNVDAGAGAGAGVSVDAVGTPSFSSLITALNAGSSVDFSAVTETTEIRIVKLSTLEGSDEDQTALDAALQTNAAARTTLQSNLEGNAIIKSKLDAEGVTAGDALAVSSEADGSLVIYIDDRM